MVHASLLCEQTAFIGAAAEPVTAGSGLEMDDLFSFGSLTWDSPPASPEYLPADAAAFLASPPAKTSASTRQLWAHEGVMESMGELNLWTPPASPPHAADDSSVNTGSSELLDFPLLDDMMDSEYSALAEAGRHSPALSDCDLLSPLGSRKRKALDDEDDDQDEDDFDGQDSATDDTLLLQTGFSAAAVSSDEDEELLGSASELSTPAPSPSGTPRGSRSSTPAAKRSRLSRSRIPSGPPAPAAAAAARKALATKSVDVLGELPLSDALQALSVIRGKADGVEVKRISHNILERKRRNDLKTCYNALRSEIPELIDNDRAPTSHILQFAHDTIRTLQKQDKKLEQQLAAARAEQRRLRARIAAAASSAARR